jgi:hypothetical protein
MNIQESDGYRGGGRYCQPADSHMTGPSKNSSSSSSGGGFRAAFGFGKKKKDKGKEFKKFGLETCRAQRPKTTKT